MSTITLNEFFQNWAPVVEVSWKFEKERVQNLYIDMDFPCGALEQIIIISTQ